MYLLTELQRIPESGINRLQSAAPAKSGKGQMTWAREGSLDFKSQTSPHPDFAIEKLGNLE